MVAGITKNQIELDHFKILGGYFENQALEMEKYTRDVYNSSELGRAIYDSGYLGIFSVIDRNYFIKNYTAIFGYFARVGTSEAYIGLFKALFGGSAETVFNPSPPGTINADITADLDGIAWAEGLTNEEITTGDGDNILFSTIFTALDLNQTESLLKLIVPYGILATFNITNTGTLKFNAKIRSY